MWAGQELYQDAAIRNLVADELTLSSSDGFGGPFIRRERMLTRPCVELMGHQFEEELLVQRPSQAQNTVA